MEEGRGAEEEEATDSSSRWQKRSEQRTEPPCSAGLCLWKPDPEEDGHGLIRLDHLLFTIAISLIVINYSHIQIKYYYIIFSVGECYF